MIRILGFRLDYANSTVCALYHIRAILLREVVSVTPSLDMYRAGTTRRASTKGGAPYDRTRAYRKGQTLMHPTFGEGEVTAIIEPQKMDVLFADRIRRMMHAYS